MSDQLREYIVTLRNKEDLDEFYQDMETPGESLYIPNRTVDLAVRRPYSRNTHYMLTTEEAETLKQDSRVLAVELNRPIPSGPATARVGEIFSTLNSQKHQSWHIARQTNQAYLGYTSGNTTRYGSAFTNSGTDRRGQDIDVLIWDGHIQQGHSEWLNHLGQSRLANYNWFQHNASLGYSYGGGNYSYSQVGGTEDWHATSVASIAAGRRHGWAPQANIYNIAGPYLYTAAGYIEWYALVDYIQAWIANKPNNPTYGNKNPTVINMSWNYFPSSIDTGVSTGTTLTDSTYLTFPISQAIVNSTVNTGYGGGWKPLPRYFQDNGYGQMFIDGARITVSALRNTYNLWIYTSDSFFAYGGPSNWQLLVPYYSAAIMADFVDLSTTPGVVLIGSAGNHNTYSITPAYSLTRYNQHFQSSTSFWYYQLGDSTITYAVPTHRGVMPAGSIQESYANFWDVYSSSGVGPIVVGATSETDNLSWYTNKGPRVDVWAPGDNLLCASQYGGSSAYYDDTNYNQGPFSGTSAASPNVAGICALWAEERRANSGTSAVTTTNFRSAIVNNTVSVNNQVNSTSTFYTSGNLSDSPNRLAIPSTSSSFKTVVNPNIVTASDIQQEFGGSNPINLTEYYRGGSYVPNTSSNIPSSGEINYGMFKCESKSTVADLTFDIISVDVSSSYTGQPYTITVRSNIAAPQNITLNILFENIVLPDNSVGAIANVGLFTLNSGNRIATYTGTTGSNQGTRTVTVTVTAVRGTALLTKRTSYWYITQST